MRHLSDKITAFWVSRTATHAKTQETILFALGLLGWMVIYRTYPFAWALPEYANY